jgi:hypothetical protein
MPIERTAEQERAAIVAWLQRIDTVFSGMPCPFKSFADVADAIERGAHLKEQSA